MKKWFAKRHTLSLRHRLMLLYTLMALAPALLGTGMMLLYLLYQIKKATHGG